jgi:hypothetical protein
MVHSLGELVLAGVALRLGWGIGATISYLLNYYVLSNVWSGKLSLK